jgi:hypothetical protein
LQGAEDRHEGCADLLATACQCGDRLGPAAVLFAPSLHCPINGVFVIPRDELIAYAETGDGWSSVMYMNPKTGDSVSGWVRSARLKLTGTVGPKQ